MKVGGIIYIGTSNLKVRISFFLCFFIVCGAPVRAQSDACGSAGVVLDHVIWAVPDLENYVDRFEAITSIRPSYGGEHTNGVTANYLLSLGPCTYLEILGLKSGITPDNLGDMASMYAHEHVAGFALSTNLKNVPDSMPDSMKGITLGPLSKGGRTKPDGSKLAWQTAFLSDFNFGQGTFQFVIDWLSEPHPAKTAQSGISLVGLTIAHPDAPKLKTLVETNGLPIVLQPAGKSGMWLTLKGPTGTIILK
jgi:hypothetical protein